MLMAWLELNNTNRNRKIIEDFKIVTEINYANNIKNIKKKV